MWAQPIFCISGHMVTQILCPDAPGRFWCMPGTACMVHEEGMPCKSSTRDGQMLCTVSGAMGSAETQCLVGQDHMQSPFLPGTLCDSVCDSCLGPPRARGDFCVLPGGRKWRCSALPLLCGTLSPTLMGQISESLTIHPAECKCLFKAPNVPGFGKLGE